MPSDFMRCLVGKEGAGNDACYGNGVNESMTLPSLITPGLGFGQWASSFTTGSEIQFSISTTFQFCDAGSGS